MSTGLQGPLTTATAEVTDAGAGVVIDSLQGAEPSGRYRTTDNGNEAQRQHFKCMVPTETFAGQSAAEAPIWPPTLTQPHSNPD